MFSQINQAVEAQGLQVRAAFHVVAADRVPALLTGEPTGTLILVGNTGSALWPVFRESAEYRDGLPDPLDRWSLRIGSQLAAQFQGSVLLPFGREPYHPFLSWAKRGDLSITSPLGLSLHPEYGLWHAFRFALCLPQQLQGLPTPVSSAMPWPPLNNCLVCQDQPCLSACPVEAFDGDNYFYNRCGQFLSEHPAAACNSLGCAARRACPVGKNYQYQPEQAIFHMQAFVALHGNTAPVDQPAELV